MSESYTGDTGLSTGNQDKSAIIEAWRKHATALAPKVLKLLVNRQDAFGGYYVNKESVVLTTTRKADDPSGPLTLATLVKHFKAKGPKDVVGLHSTYRDEAGVCWSRWLGIDVDRHSDGGDPEANLRFVLALYLLLVQLGFKPILTDSDGKGGYHVLIVFDAPVRTETVFAFGRWLIRDWKSYALEKEPETFPKQPGIPEGGFGNWMRVFGRHPKRDHWSRVWDGTHWLEGLPAVKFFITTEGASEDLIPAQALPDPNAPFDLGRDIERKRAQGEAADLGQRAPRPKADDGTTEPGEDFNTRASWQDILGPHGWRLDHESEGTGFWTRPGKNSGVSATTNHNGNNTLYVFTDGSKFAQGGSYSLFGAFTLLEHNGDFKVAARSLAQQGYGTFAELVEKNGEQVREIRQNPRPVRPQRRAKADPGPNANGEHEGNGQPPIDPPANGQVEQPQPGRPLSLNQRLARRPRTDLGNAERMVARHGGDLRYCHPWKKWLVWDGRRWRVDNTAEVHRRARRTVRSILVEAKTIDDVEHRKALALWQMTSEGRDKRLAMIQTAEAEEGIPILPEDLDKDPWLLNCLNGTLELKTGLLREHRREDLITKVCPVRYDGNALCPFWTSTQDKVFAGNDDLIGFFQRLCGYILTGTSTEQILPILHGVGANGKSTLMTTLLDMLGTDYGLKAAPELLMVKRSESHPTERASLFGKRLVVAIETGEGARINETLIKELTGSDIISARRMREDFWEFKPSHKILLATNHRPAVRGTDHAIWRRLKLIPFNVIIPDEQADRDMPTKLLGELPGILAWCVRGCLDWQEVGLKPPAEVTDATEEYRREEDVLGGFLEEHCVLNPSLRSKSTPLYDRYRKWAEASGETPVNQTKFGKALGERGFSRVKDSTIFYVGIGLRSQDDEDQSEYT